MTRDSSITQKPTNTALLLRRIHAGEEQALRELVERNLDFLESQVRSQLSPDLRRRAETGDYLHDAVLYVLRYGPKFVVSDADHCRAILGRMVRNLLYDRMRWSRAMQRDQRRERSIGSDSVLYLDPPVAGPVSAHALAEKNEDRVQLRFCVELLSAGDRDVMLLRYWQDLSFEEIGSRLGLTPEGVRSRHHRALKKLAGVSYLVRNYRIGEALDADEDGGSPGA